MHEFLAVLAKLDGPSRDANVSAVYQRIAAMQDRLLLALDKHDALIQEKVAQLALTGDRSEST